MQDASPVFKNPLPNRIINIKLRTTKIFKAGFKKLSTLNYMVGGGESSCLRHYDALRSKIDM